MRVSLCLMLRKKLFSHEIRALMQRGASGPVFSTALQPFLLWVWGFVCVAASLERVLSIVQDLNHEAGFAFESRVVVIVRDDGRGGRLFSSLYW